MSAAQVTPDRRVVDCPHGETCGACALLGESYERQLERKRAVMAAALQRHARLGGVMPLPCLPSPRIAGYRNRAKLAVELPRSRPPRLGYFRAGSRSLVDAPECRVLVPEVLETAQALREVLGTRAAERLPLRFIDIRCGSDPREQHLTLITSTSDARIPLAAIRAACPHVRGISHNVNAGASAQVLRGRITPAWGERHVHVDAGGVRLHVSAGSFFQVNLGMLALIHDRLRELFEDCDVLADLYSGVGTHALALHAQFQRVLAIEGVTSAVRDARTTVAAGHVGNAVLIASPVERALGRFEAESADAVVLNPSREGAMGEVLHAVAASNARRVAYLSCDPSTLARDLDVLVTAGLRIVSVEPLDMMPQTLQVEALALLERPAPRRPAGRPERAARPRGRSRPR
jgi:23S rRNA (uracil-5-)-methyltransferase RumA